MEIFPQLQLILNKIFFVNFLVHIHAHYEYHRYALHDDSNAYPNHCSNCTNSSVSNLYNNI
jgi:hypothetical protein